MLNDRMLILASILFVIFIIMFDVVLNVNIKYGTYTKEYDYVLYKVKRNSAGKYIPEITIWNWIFQFLIVLLLVLICFFVWYAIDTKHVSNKNITGVNRLRQRENTVQLDRPTVEAAAKNYTPRDSL